jgi:hypothetical protein
MVAEVQPDYPSDWPGRVVVHLVFGQDGTQVRLADDQHDPAR